MKIPKRKQRTRPVRVFCFLVLLPIGVLLAALVREQQHQRMGLVLGVAVSVGRKMTQFQNVERLLTPITPITPIKEYSIEIQ